jgi:hypothetical protein
MLLISLESTTESSFMERLGGQRVGPPQRYRRGFAAASRILPSLPSRCDSEWAALSQLRDIRASALDPSVNDDANTTAHPIIVKRYSLTG